MDDFKFTPDEAQPVSSNDSLGFSFTPDEVQPDFTKVHLSDVNNSNDPVAVLTQTAKSLMGMVSTGGTNNPVSDAAFNTAYNVTKGLVDNKEIVGEYIKETPKATLGLGIKAGEAIKGFYKGVENKLAEEELYQFQGDTKLSGVKEAAKALGNEAFVVTPKIASEVTYWLSKNMADPNGKDNAISEGFSGLSTMFDKFSKYMGDVDIFKSSAIKLPNGKMSWGNIGEAAGHGIGQGAVMGTAARLFGPKFAYGIYAMAGGASVFKESYEKEGDLGKANTLGTVTAATTYALDRWINPLPENIAKGAKITVKEILKDIPKSAAKEVPNEIFQQVLSENLVRKIGIDAEQDLYESIAEIAISAAFGGASMAAAGGVSGYIADRSYEKAKEKAIEKGATESEVEQYKDATMEKFKNHSDVFSAKFQANAEKAFNDLNTFIEQNGSEEEVRKAVEKKQQLEKIYNDTYNELKNIMPEQEAKSNAALIRNSAFFYANEFGISPEEFVKKRGVKVVKSDYEQFKGNKTTENMPIMQVTQKDLNYARSHPEWKSNARIIEMISQAGADINDDINTINKALKQYSIEENKFRKEKEDAQYNLWAKDLDEAKQERYAMMVENGVKPQDAYNAVTYVEDYIPFQTQIANITKQKAREVKNALQEIANGAEEATVKDLRDDLDQYGGTNDITFIYGDEKKGLFHIADKHGGMKTLLKVLDAVVDGDVIRHVKAKKTVVIEKDGYEAVLSLDEHGNKKTWLLTGWDTKISPDEEREFRATLNSTQLKPTFSRQELGAELNNFIINEDAESVNQNVQFQESLNIAVENAALDKVNPAHEGETININGVERTVYNSNGDRIAMSEPALRNFYNWFGDSKVVDEQGRPLVVYHGTNKEFDSFDKKLLGTTTLAYSARQGFFFTDSEDVANSYGDYAAIYQPINELRKKQEMAERWGDWDTVDELTIKIEELDRKISQTPANERGKKIYPVYLKAEDVLEYDAKDEYFSDIGDEINDVLLKAKKQGKDGVVLKNLKDQPLVFDEKSSNHFMVFEPNQIKSTSNRGTYSESDNIYLQSAFAASRVDYDKPSLEAIGSGEGAQVHGWGLYYALSKDVAETYRKTFEDQKPKDIYVYQGDGYLPRIYMEQIDKFGIEKTLEAYERKVEQWKVEGRYNPDSIDAKVYESLKNYKDGDIHIERAPETKTQVHEVDIPENPYLLDEQKPFSEQSEYVKERLEKIISNLPEKYLENYPKMGLDRVKEIDFLGSEIYGTLEEAYGSPKEASKILEKYGIKGITYDGKQDGRCFVIFNPDDVKVIQKFYQDGANDPKGAYVNRIIHLFQNADASTLPHELAHFWKDTLKDAAKISKRAAKMLEDVEKWAEQEFNRKYSVQLKDGRYVVNNKQGLTVYDHNFRTEADAKEYAKEELFAQGNEAFLKEGVAPNNSLKQAFRNFLNWLKHIYNQARQLDIRLSPEIRQVYADILGGTEIDFFLNTDPDTFVENRIKLATETVKSLDEQIEEAQRMGVTVSEPDGRGLKHVWETAMIPLSTRLGRVSNKLKNRLRRYEFDIANSLNHYYDEARPFLQKWKTFSEMDTIAFDIALKNDYVKKQLEIVEKYGAREEWEKVRKLLLDIFDSAVKAGLDVNFRPDYFPRKVKDVQGFLSYLRGRPEWTKFEEALKDADPDHTFTAEEQADFINKYLRGFIKVDLMPYKYGSEKQRSIEIINNEMNKYYAPSMESLVSYIEGMNARIEASKFLGRDAENLDASVGGYLDYLINNNEIDPNKVDEVKEILKARFNQKGVGNKWIAGARNISYMYTMGGINSAITQIEDLSVSMYKAGIWNTLTTAFENKKIKRADLGLDKISAEFVENPSRTAKGVDKLFKLTGLDKIDSFGKETLVNAMVKKFKQMSEESLRQYIEPIMEQETTQTIQDIKNGEMSDNVLYLVFSELSDVQPISLSELPAFYNTSGNLRILYMLKSFMVKRIDIFRNECFDKLRSKNKEARIQGIQNLFKLAILMIFCGVSKDWLINLLYGRKMDIPEVVVNNALGLVGFSKFHAYQLRDKGAGEVIKDFLMPPMFAPYDDLIGDVVRIARGKRDLKDAESFKGIPLVGRFYYWHIGRGKEKMKKRNKSKLK